MRISEIADLLKPNQVFEVAAIDNCIINIRIKEYSGTGVKTKSWAWMIGTDVQLNHNNEELAISKLLSEINK